MAPSYDVNIEDVEPLSRTYQYRKVMKPMLERKRRARINNSLDALKDLMVGAIQHEGESITKLEKADVLELTVNHLKKLQKHHALAIPAESQTHEKFTSGFRQCAGEVSKFINTIPGIDIHVSNRLMSHLGSCMKQLENIAAANHSPIQSTNSPTTPITVTIPKMYTPPASPDTTKQPPVNQPINQTNHLPNKPINQTSIPVQLRQSQQQPQTLLVDSPVIQTIYRAPLQQSPASLQQSSASLQQSPVSLQQSPASLHQSPASLHQSPASLHQSPASLHQSPPSPSPPTPPLSVGAPSPVQYIRPRILQQVPVPPQMQVSPQLQVLTKLQVIPPQQQVSPNFHTPPQQFQVTPKYEILPHVQVPVQQTFKTSPPLQRQQQQHQYQQQQHQHQQEQHQHQQQQHQQHNQQVQDVKMEDGDVWRPW